MTVQLIASRTSEHSRSAALLGEMAQSIAPATPPLRLRARQVIATTALLWRPPIHRSDVPLIPQ